MHNTQYLYLVLMIHYIFFWYLSYTTILTAMVSRCTIFMTSICIIIYEDTCLLNRVTGYMYITYSFKSQWPKNNKNNKINVSYNIYHSCKSVFLKLIWPAIHLKKFCQKVRQKNSAKKILPPFGKSIILKYVNKH